MKILDKLKDAGINVALDLVGGVPVVGGLLKSIGKSLLGNENATEDEIVNALPSDPHELEKLLQQNNIEYTKLEIEKEKTLQEKHKTIQQEIKQDVDYLNFLCAFIKIASRYKGVCMVLGGIVALYSTFVFICLWYIFFISETLESKGLRDGTQHVIITIALCLLLLPASNMSRHIRKLLDILLDSFLEPMLKAFVGSVTSILSIPSGTGEFVKSIIKRK